jgi:MFS family permease
MSLWEVGLILSVNRFVRLPLNPVMGWLYTRIPLRTGLLAAVALAAFTTFGYGIAQGLWPWLLLRCTWGVAWSLLRLGGFMTVVAQSEDHNRGYLMGTYNGLYRLGSLFGMLLGGGGATLIGIEWVAILMGAVSLLGIPLIVLFVQPQPAAQPMRPETALPGALNWKSFSLWKVMGSGFFVSLLIQGVLTSTLSFLIDRRFTEEVRIWGITMAAATLSGIIQASRWAWEPFLAVKFGRWSDGPRGRMPWFCSFLLVAAFGFVCTPIGGSVTWWIAVILLVMVASTALTTLMDTLASDTSKHAQSLSVMTLYSVVLDFGAAAGPIVAFLLLSLKNGLLVTYWGGAVIFFMICLLWFDKGMLRGRSNTAPSPARK